MNKDKEIVTKNSKGQCHGYCVLYNGAGIYLRGVIKYYNYVGYQEWHGGKATRFHIR